MVSKKILLKSSLVLMLAFLSLSLVSTFYYWDHPRFTDLRHVYRLQKVLSNTVANEVSGISDAEIHQDIKDAAKVMALAFDSVETANGSFDYVNYPYAHSMEIILEGKQKMLCGEMSSFFGFLINQLGFKTRIVQLLGKNYVNGSDRYDSHVAVEFKLKSQDRWVLADPTFDAFWSCGGQRFINYKTLRSCIENGVPIKPIHLRSSSAGIKQLRRYYPPEQVFYAGRAVRRGKSYNFMDWFKYKISGAEVFMHESYEAVYELPREGIYIESVRRFKE